ncbi:MAG: pilus assembly protein CpaF, partial [Actinomycetota bacterium]|nr:pilus assembly protein CpaF [Actinomycetota bacterium]
MSLYRRLQDAQATTTPSGRNPLLDELRQRIHHQLIDELGAVLYDKRLSEDDLRDKVQESLQAALLRETAPISAADRAQLLSDVSDD